MPSGRQKEEDEEELPGVELGQAPEPVGLMRSSRGRVVKPKRWDDDTVMATVPLGIDVSHQELATEDDEEAHSEDSGTDEHYSPMNDPEEILEQAGLTKARRSLSMTNIDPRGSIPVRDQAGRFVGVRPRTVAEQRQVHQEACGRGGGIFKSAAVEVLRKERRLMSTGEIARAALKMGLINVQGKTPEATMASALYTDIKRKEGQSIFIRPHEGLFGLREWADMGITFKEPEKPTYCLDDMKPFKRPAAPERARSTPQTGLPEFHPATKAVKDNSGNRRLPLFLPHAGGTLVKAASERLPDLPPPPPHVPARRVESHNNLAMGSLSRSTPAHGSLQRRSGGKKSRGRANSSNLDLLLDAAEELSCEERADGKAASLPAPTSARKELNTAAEAPKLPHQVAIHVSRPKALTEHRQVSLELKRPATVLQQPPPEIVRHNTVVTTGQPFLTNPRQPPVVTTSRTQSQPLPLSSGLNAVPDSAIIRSPSEPQQINAVPACEPRVSAFRLSEPQRSAFQPLSPTRAADGGARQQPTRPLPRIAQAGNLLLTHPQISKPQPSRPQPSRPEPIAPAEQAKVPTSNAEPAIELATAGSDAADISRQFGNVDLGQADLGVQLVRQFEANLASMEETFGKAHPKTGKAWLFMARVYQSFNDPQNQVKAQDALQRAYEICTSAAFQKVDD